MNESTTQAVRFHEAGGADVLQHETVPVPAPSAGEVRVRVAASAFNPADAGMRGGFLPIPVSLPHVPGYDVSGTVDALGPGVQELQVGDAVVGFLPMERDGGAAQFVVARADALVAAPTTLDLADAAAVPSVGLTAWQALFEAGRLAAGQRLLVNGAGGAVGGYAVQLAKRAGAQVVATASPRSTETVIAQGADQVVDHTRQSVLEAVEAPVDVLLNLAPVSEEDFVVMAALVRDGGVVVSTTPMVPTPSDVSRGVRGETIFVHPDRATLTELVGLVDSGALSVDVAAHVPLDRLADVHRRADAGEVRGKVVVVPPAAG